VFPTPPPSRCWGRGREHETGRRTHPAHRHSEGQAQQRRAVARANVSSVLSALLSVLLSFPEDESEDSTGRHIAVLAFTERALTSVLTSFTYCDCVARDITL
jgi:hypothetical protein